MKTCDCCAQDFEKRDLYPTKARGNATNHVCRPCYVDLNWSEP